MLQQRESAWWSIVFAMIAHVASGAVWHGVTIEPVWDVDYDYLLGYSPLPDDEGWRVDVAGRWARAAEVKYDPAPLVWRPAPAGRWTQVAATKDERLSVYAELVDAKELRFGDIREVVLGQGGGRIDPKTGQFWCSMIGTKIGVYHGQPVRLRITVRVDNHDAARVTLPGTVRLKR